MGFGKDSLTKPHRRLLLLASLSLVSQLYQPLPLTSLHLLEHIGAIFCPRASYPVFLNYLLHSFFPDGQLAAGKADKEQAYLKSTTF
jgi:hypothetical protein